MMKAVFVFLFLIITQVPELYSQQSDKSGKPRKENKSKVQYGTASYYHSKFQGRKTANGDIYDKDKPTAAHNSLPFGTWIKVTNLRNKKSIIVRVNDRLHYKNARLVDLSSSAASKLGYIGRGLARVKVEVLGKKKPAELSQK